ASLSSATKFGLRGFALALHEDLRNTGVGVTAIFPGFISGEGLWGDTDMELPPGGGRLRTPDDVGAAVLKGITTGRPEIDVAPMVQRSGGWLTGFAPRLVAATIRRAGGAGLSADLAEAQREKRQCATDVMRAPGSRARTRTGPSEPGSHVGPVPHGVRAGAG